MSVQVLCPHQTLFVSPPRRRSRSDHIPSTKVSVSTKFGRTNQGEVPLTFTERRSAGSVFGLTMGTGEEERVWCRQPSGGGHLRRPGTEKGRDTRGSGSPKGGRDASTPTTGGKNSGKVPSTSRRPKRGSTTVFTRIILCSDQHYKRTKFTETPRTNGSPLSSSENTTKHSGPDLIGVADK